MVEGDSAQFSEPRTCPWCSAVVPDEATRCPKCDAAVAQREALGDLVIPGVTGVDPAMRSDRSVLQGVMRVQAAANRAGVGANPIPFFGPPGMETIVHAAVFGREMVDMARIGGDLLSTGAGTVDASHIGEPTELARMIASQLDGAERAGPGDMGETAETGDVAAGGVAGEAGPEPPQPNGSEPEDR